MCKSVPVCVDVFVQQAKAFAALASVTRCMGFSRSLAQMMELTGVGQGEEQREALGTKDTDWSQTCF